MFRKFIAITKYLCFAALAAAALFIGVSAGGLTLALPDGSIALNCSIERDGQMMYLAGDTYALSKIADLSIESGSKIRYRISEAFAAYECDWASLSDSERAKAAKLMAEDAKEHRLYCAQVETDAYGRGCFDCLAPGLYLISRIKAAQENDVYHCAPFLVSVPTVEGITLEYEVAAKPKFSWDRPKPTAEPDLPVEKSQTDPADPAGNAPFTGVRPSFWPQIAACSGFLVLFISCLRWLCAKQNAK